MLKNLLGLIIMYGWLRFEPSVFLYHGFIKSVPRSVEEARLSMAAHPPAILPRGLSSSEIDYRHGNYFKCNVDLERLSAAFLVIGNSDFKTLTLEIYYAKMLSGQYGNPWELIFPAVLVSIIPIIIVFLSLQKYFVKGVSDGAVKM